MFPPEPLHGRKRVRAFIDFQFGRDASTAADAGATSQPGGEKQGDSSDASSVHRVVVELADDLVPLTVRNFLEVRRSGTTMPVQVLAASTPRRT